MVKKCVMGLAIVFGCSMSLYAMKGEKPASDRMGTAVAGKSLFTPLTIKTLVVQFRGDLASLQDLAARRVPTSSAAEALPSDEYAVQSARLLTKTTKYYNFLCGVFTANQANLDCCYTLAEYFGLEVPTRENLGGDRLALGPIQHRIGIHFQLLGKEIKRCQEVLCGTSDAAPKASKSS